MSTRTFLVAVVCLAGAAACQRHANAPPAPPLGTVLPNIPFPPGGQPAGQNSGSDATQLQFVSTVSADSVTKYYRQLFSRPPYQLVNETTSGTTTVFYVEQKGPSMWVTVEASGDSASRVTIAGAVEPDTTTRSAHKPAG
jgi:hypothetical protein